jgi:hypothetical protein
MKISPRKAWEKLIAPHAPKETDNGEYTFDNNSSGIYTPVLEGVARMNPLKFRDQYYIRAALNLEKLGDNALDKNKYELALRSYSKALITSMIGSHVNYYYKVIKKKVEPDNKIKSLLKACDADIMYLIGRLHNKRFILKKLLLDQGQVDLVTKVEKEFNLYRKAPRSGAKNYE